jgi:hypothetical protein
MMFVLILGEDHDYHFRDHEDTADDEHLFAQKSTALLLLTLKETQTYSSGSQLSCWTNEANGIAPPQ